MTRLGQEKRGAVQVWKGVACGRGHGLQEKFREEIDFEEGDCEREELRRRDRSV